MKIFISIAGICLSVTLLLAAQPPAAAPVPVVTTSPAPGNREVTTFMLFKDKQPMTMGALQVMIRKLDSKAQKYSVDIQLGTRHMEKKDIYAGEPIVFYGPNDDQATEFLVRQVFDDHIEGRLTAPRPLPPLLPQK